MRSLRGCRCSSAKMSKFLRSRGLKTPCRFPCKYFTPYRKLSKEIADRICVDWP